MKNEDKWDEIYNALNSVDVFLYLEEKGFADKNGLTARGNELRDKMKKVFSMC